MHHTRNTRLTSPSFPGVGLFVGWPSFGGSRPPALPASCLVCLGLGMVLHLRLRCPCWSIAEMMFGELLLFLCYFSCVWAVPLTGHFILAGSRVSCTYVSVVFPSDGTSWSSLLDTGFSHLTLISFTSRVICHFSPTVSYTHNTSFRCLGLPTIHSVTVSKPTVHFVSAPTSTVDFDLLAGLHYVVRAVRVPSDV